MLTTHLRIQTQTNIKLSVLPPYHRSHQVHIREANSLRKNSSMENDLIEYDIQYTTQKAIKGSVLADHLAHQAVDDYQSMNFEFSNEDIMLVTDLRNLNRMKDLKEDPDRLWFLMELPTHLAMASVL